MDISREFFGYRQSTPVAPHLPPSLSKFARQSSRGTGSGTCSVSLSSALGGAPPSEARWFLSRLVFQTKSDEAQHFTEVDTRNRQCVTQVWLTGSAFVVLWAAIDVLDTGKNVLSQYQSSHPWSGPHRVALWNRLFVLLLIQIVRAATSKALLSVEAAFMLTSCLSSFIIHFAYFSRTAMLLAPLFLIAEGSKTTATYYY